MLKAMFGCTATVSLALLAMGWAPWLGAQEVSSSNPEENAQINEGPAVLLTIEGPIGPATSDFVTRSAEQAQEIGAAMIVIEIDTPGGLDTSMREIIQSILGSPIPVVTFVSPQGARAASAGTYILYASHIAVMAPATNLGAATPVAIGGPTPMTPDASPTDETQDPSSATNGENSEVPSAENVSPNTTLERKAINDAVAYIRSLAEQRGRNAEWAEAAVRSAESLSAQAALENNVIDLIADDLTDLLQQLDGWEVDLNGSVVTINTTGLPIQRFEPDWRTRVLEVISNPTLAYLLMLVGIYGLILEGYNPGGLLPGVVGAISLLLDLFAFQVLPINYAGLALILLGIILMIGEFLMPSFGVLGIGGVAAFVFGSVILVDTDVLGFGVSVPLIFAISFTAALALMGIIWFAMKSRARSVVSGIEEMAGTSGRALESFDREGQIWVHGERWLARASEPIARDQNLRVIKVEGLLLYVEPSDVTN
jgi:membrane-bound serine protease (ClpP class)